MPRFFPYLRRRNYSGHLDTDARFKEGTMNSLLFLSIQLGHWNIANFLINAGVLIRKDDLVEATKIGQVALVVQILGKMPGLSIYNSQSPGIIETAISYWRFSIADQMLKAGIRTERLHLVTIFTLPTVATIR